MHKGYRPHKSLQCHIFSLWHFSNCICTDLKPEYYTIRTRLEGMYLPLSFLLVADARVSEGAAVLMCIVPPANCVTPICPLSIPKWCIAWKWSSRPRTKFYGKVNLLSELWIWWLKTAPNSLRHRHSTYRNVFIWHVQTYG